MPYIDSEFRNMRLVWSTVGDRVLIIGLIILGMVFASALVTHVILPPSEIPLIR